MPECPHLGSGAVQLTGDWLTLKCTELLAQVAKPPPSTSDVRQRSPADDAPPTPANNGTTGANRTPIWQCCDCRSTGDNWLCLHCGSVRCGRYLNQHALQHATGTDGHSVCISAHSHDVYCYVCDEFVANDTDDGRLRALRNILKIAEQATDDDDGVQLTDDDDDVDGHAATAHSDAAHAKKSRRSVSDASASTGTSAVSCDSGIGAEALADRSPNGTGGSHFEPTANVASDAENRQLRPRKRKASGPIGGNAKSKPAEKQQPASPIAAMIGNSNSSCNASGPAALKRKAPRRAIGIRNLGNTCFMNGVLQTLSNIPEFSSFFSHLPSVDPLITKLSKAKRMQLHSCHKENYMGASSFTVFIEELRKLLMNLKMGGNGSKAISPDSLLHIIWKLAPAYRGHRQQDAHEFLRFILDQVHIDMQENRLHTANSGISAVSAAADDCGKRPTTDGALNHTNGLSRAPAGNGLASDGHAQPAAGSSAGAFCSGPIEAGCDMFCGQSIVTELFGGSLQNIVRCLTCGTESRKQDPFLDISLEIPERFYAAGDPAERVTRSSSGAGEPKDQRTPAMPTCHLSDCLDSYIEVEVLAPTELYFCAACDRKQPSTKRFFIKQLPKVLCLHIKRFCWKQILRSKIDVPMKFPVEALDMSKFLLNSPERSEANVYDLATALVHHGTGSCNGHYTAYGRSNGTWYHFNDHNVKEVHVHEVEDSKPYILFYTRRDLLKS